MPILPRPPVPAKAATEKAQPRSHFHNLREGADRQGLSRRMKATALPALAGHQPADRTSRRSSSPSARGPLFVLDGVIVLAALGGLAFWLLTNDQQTTDDACTDGRAVIMSPHVADYVTVLAVNDNQFVHKGDLLVQIESRDYQGMRDQVAG